MNMYTLEVSALVKTSLSNKKKPTCVDLELFALSLLNDETPLRTAETLSRFMSIILCFV